MSISAPMVSAPAVTVFIAFIEAIMVTVLGFNIFNIKSKISELFYIAILMGPISYGLTFLNLKLPYHVLLKTFLLAIVIYIVMHQNFFLLATSSFVGLVIYLMLSTISLSLVLTSTGWSTELLAESGFLRLLAFSPQVVGVFLLVAILKFFTGSQDDRNNHKGTKHSIDL